MKAIEHYFHVVLFIIPDKVILTLMMAETVVCDCSSGNLSSDSYCFSFFKILVIAGV